MAAQSLRTHPLRRPGLDLRRRRAALDPRLLDLGIPVLGICYGMQAMADALGGEVARTGAAEFGKTELDVRGGVLLHDVGEVDSCWMSHNDAVVRAPDGFGVTASTPSTPVAAMEDPERGLYAVQFHPEVQHTPRGTDMLKNFLYPRVSRAGDLDRAGRDRRAGRADPRAGRRRAASCAVSRAASTRPWPRCSCTARSASS